MRMKILAALFLLGITSVIASCSAAQIEQQEPSVAGNSSPTNLKTQTAQVPGDIGEVKSSTTDRSIRSIDFANFTYPYDCVGIYKKGFALRNGEEQKSIDKVPMRLSYVLYGDVTSDGKEEAMVVLSVPFTGGTMRLHCVYIFGLQNGSPKLLRTFETGDRADRGLRQVYAESGQLIVEQYKKTVNDGDCCAAFFTRNHYQWQNGRFRRAGKEEQLTNPNSGSPSAPIMQPIKAQK